MKTREEMEAAMKQILNEGLDLSDHIMKSAQPAVIMAAVCILEDFLQNNKPLELAVMKKLIGNIRTEIEDKKGTFNA